jgi:hypothetical protein
MVMAPCVLQVRVLWRPRQAGTPVASISLTVVTHQKEETVLETREIPRAGWHDFFDAFTRNHETDLVAVEIMGNEIGAQIQGRSLLFGGISPAQPNDESLALMFDSTDGEHLTHTVEKPTHIWLQRTFDHTDRALEIESADGTKTLVRFGGV